MKLKLLALALLFSLFISCKKETPLPECGVVVEKIERPGSLIVKVKLVNTLTELRDYTNKGQYFYHLKVGDKDCR